MVKLTVRLRDHFQAVEAAVPFSAEKFTDVGPTREEVERIQVDGRLLVICFDGQDVFESREPEPVSLFDRLGLQSRPLTPLAG